MDAWHGFHAVQILEVNMKKLVLAAALTAAASTAYAGNIQEPLIEAPIIVEEATGSSQGILLPLIIVLLIAAAVAAD